MAIDNQDRQAIGYFYKTLADYRAKNGADVDLMTPISCIMATSEENAISQIDSAQAAIRFFNDYYLVFTSISDREIWVKIKEAVDHAIPEY